MNTAVDVAFALMWSPKGDTVESVLNGCLGEKQKHMLKMVTANVCPPQVRNCQLLVGRTNGRSDR